MELHQLQLVEVPQAPPCRLGCFWVVSASQGLLWVILAVIQVLGWSCSHTCVLQPPVRRWILQ